MMWKLVSYSEIDQPLFPFKVGYVIGIVENEKGLRRVVQIDKKFSRILLVGIEGKLEEIEGPDGKIDVFLPC